MRIALTYPDVNLAGGVERVVVATANFLARAGHDVHVFASSFDESVLDPAVERHHVAVPRRPDALFALTYRRRATAALQAAGPFDVHGSFSALSPLGGVYWTPSVHAAALEVLMERRDAKARLVQRLNPYHAVRLRLERETFASGGYARVVGQTQDVCRDAVRLYGVPETDVEALALGYDEQVFSAARGAELRDRARAEHGFGEDDRVIAFVANELERKGYDTLLRALAHLDGAKLLVAGRADPARYGDLARTLGVADRVRWAGHSGDVAVPLAAADAFALPTRYEPWGLVIVEALASGLPVVTSRLAGAAAVIREGETGALLDDPDDAGALADGLRWALGEGPAAPETISASVTDYTWDRVLTRYEAILRDVAERQAGREAATAVGAAKPLGYYGASREDVVAHLPQPLGRVLDVGCGAGGVGRSLRAAGAAELWGVEIVPEAAAAAREVFDEVIEGGIEEALGSGAVRGPFDTIVCYDVLEHLVDPEAVLRALLPLAAPGGRLHVSCPNARHFSLVKDLVLRGTFGYTEYGHRDATHLRWFTRSDLVAAVERAGWNVESWRPNTFRGRDRPFDRATLGLTREFIALQWIVLARAPG